MLKLLVCTLALTGCAMERPTGRDNTPPRGPDTTEADPPQDSAGTDTEESGPKEPVSAPEVVPGPEFVPPEPVVVPSEAEEPASEAPAVWRDTSTRIHVETRNYWLGGMQFERAAADLTVEQRELLRGLTRAEPDPSFCIYDALEATVTVFDADGSSETFEMERSTCYYDGPLLTYASVKAFLDTLSCLTRADFRGPPGSQMPPEVPPTVVANDGCTHGLHDSAPWIMLDVSDASVPYTIESLDCDDNEVEIDLYDGTRETLLATGVAATPAGCATLSFQFPAAGRYALHVEGAGDYALRVSAQ